MTRTYRRLVFLWIAFAAASLWAAVVAYTYDDAGRLTKVDYGNGSTITYTYDNAGNLLSKTVTGASQAVSKGKDRMRPNRPPVQNKTESAKRPPSSSSK